MKKVLLFFYLTLVFIQVMAQQTPANFPVLEEGKRRLQLVEMDSNRNSFLLRPMGDDFGYHLFQDSNSVQNSPFDIRLLPVLQTIRGNSRRPYGWADYGMIPNVGWQSYTTAGFFAKWKFLSVQISPEIHAAQNLPFRGYQENLGDAAHRQSFLLWNYGDYPERFGNSPQGEFLWGQSKVAIGLGAFEAGIATQSLWWGPGQWSALTFSNNAQSFPYLTFNTRRPAKTFLGNFEGQIISGRIDESGLMPTQNASLNDRFFEPFTGDWKYVNAITINYSPKWISGLSLGLTRTAQIYRDRMDNSFGDIFPIFEGLTKEQFFDEDGTTVDFDSDGRDQQITAFARWVIPKLNFEFYGEYGRRDHPLNWRELIINPEHARAYIIGFNKLVKLGSPDTYIQLRGEMTQQHESINRIIRYGPRGGVTWHTHTPTRGFAQRGQSLGTGIGVGANIQIFEIARVEKLNKIGLIFQRLENNQTFYNRALLQETERKPWVDLSLGLLFDHQWDRLLLSSRLQYIRGRNYQWQLAPDSTPLFPKGQNLNSLHGQVSLVYLWNQR